MVQVTLFGAGKCPLFMSTCGNALFLNTPIQTLLGTYVKQLKDRRNCPFLADMVWNYLERHALVTVALEKIRIIVCFFSVLGTQDIFLFLQLMENKRNSQTEI